MSKPDALREKVSQLLGEAFSMRYGYENDLTTLDGQQTTLFQIRGRLDRLESILVNLIGMRGEAEEMRRSAQYEYQAANDDVLATIRRQEYEGPKERYAHANVATAEEALAAKRAADLYNVLNTAVDQVRTMHRGLSDCSSDIKAYMTSQRTATNLEAPRG